MKHLGFLVACFLLPVSLLGGEISGGVRVDVAWNQEVDLRSYNGPNVEIAIRSREMQTVNYWIVDHENSVAVARTNINSVDVDRSGQATVWGTNRVEVKAPTKEHSISLGMSGLRVSDSNREAHLLYSHASGLKVYWFDVLDTKQNQCALLVVPAARPAIETAVLSAAEQIKAIDRLEASGVLQPAEARAKRSAVTNGR